MGWYSVRRLLVKGVEDERRRKSIVDIRKSPMKGGRTNTPVPSLSNSPVAPGLLKSKTN